VRRADRKEHGRRKAEAENRLAGHARHTPIPFSPDVVLEYGLSQNPVKMPSAGEPARKVQTQTFPPSADLGSLVGVAGSHPDRQRNA
jgi:hypothetical protein